MSFEFFLLPIWQTILAPRGALGWLAWIGLLGLLLVLIWIKKGEIQTWTSTHRRTFVGLALITPLSGMLLVLRMPSEGALPIPLLGGASQVMWLPMLAASPWMVAGVLLGTIPAVVLAALSGLLLAAWGTRSPFTPLEVALLAAFFASAFGQNYRTTLFGWLRRPLVAGLLGGALFALLYVFTSPFWAGPSLVASLDFSLSQIFWIWIGIILQMLIGAGLVNLIFWRWPRAARPKTAEQPSPAERSLEARLLFALGPVVALLFMVLGVLIWVMASRSADHLLSERLRGSTDAAADGVPFLLETGQSLILQLAEDPTLLTGTPEEIRATLAKHLGAVPYFEQFVVITHGGESIAGFPVADLQGLQPVEREFDALILAFEGIPLQFFAIQPIDANRDAAQLSFVAAIRAGDGTVTSVLLGRTRLGSNPFAQPILQSLRSLDAIGAQGLLVDADGQIVYHPKPASLLAPYNGQRGDELVEYEDTTSEGARRRVLYHPVTGSNWAVISQLPVSAIQQWAIDLALPMLAILSIAALVAYVLLRRSLYTVTLSLQELVQESRRIAAGELDAPLNLRSADEIGRLGEAFERMRQALKTRIGEIQRLLSVSQGVAGSLDLHAQIDPILKAALAGGASSVRMVFANLAADGLEIEKQTAFGSGPLAEVYRLLDGQMLALTSKQPRVLITNPARARLQLAKDVPQPLALAAFALQEDGRHLGALWLAFDEPQSFEAESIRYLETLSKQASLAAANAALYLDARLGRERIEAVLAATPDPVLVTEQNGRLLLANPAAWQVLGFADLPSLGKPLEDLISPTQADLLTLVNSESGKEPTAEVTFPDGRVFYGTSTAIEIEGQPMGRTIVLREITQFKQIEALRTEFLSTVSHDLRDPLELSRGYLSMLDMVGSLNDKQIAYAQKIEHSINGMARLVSNLLDLERIQSGQGLQIEAFAITELLEEVKNDLEPRALQKQVSLRVDMPETGLPIIQADRTLLQRAIYNLLDNAIKFSPRDGQVEIWLSPTEDTLTLGFKDHGAGIAPVDLPHVFERMRRPTKGTTDGRDGLGLAIVKSIIERHKGRVWLESELGLGSTFFCQIPLQAD